MAKMSDFNWSSSLALVIGIILGVGATEYSTWRERSHTRESLKSAFMGEISAMATQNTVLGRIETWEYHVNSLKQGEDHCVVMEQPERHFVVFEANADKLGMLPAPLPGKVSTFYATANALRSNLRQLACPKAERFSVAEQIRSLDIVLKRWREWSALGTEIIADLKQ